MIIKNKYVNQPDVIRNVAKQTGFYQETVEIILEAFYKYIMDSLRQGVAIYLRQFGLFYLSHGKRTVGFYPRQKQRITIDTRYFKPKFRFNRKYIDEIKHLPYNPELVVERLWRHKKAENTTSQD